jgi:hypothetical protein
MRYLKKHQVPFNGWSWDHPFRVCWRESGNLDPILSLHPWKYAFREMWWAFISWMVIIGSILATISMLGTPVEKRFEFLLIGIPFVGGRDICFSSWFALGGTHSHEKCFL